MYPRVRRWMSVLPVVLSLGCQVEVPVEDPSSPTVPDSPITPGAYQARGDFAVGYRVYDVGNALTVKAWYPADADGMGEIDYPVTLQLPGFPTDPLPFFGAAHSEAPPQSGRFPVIVFSHGFSLNPEWYLDLVEHLASWGFVVLAPQHTESDWKTDVVASTVTRPLDVSATLDFAADGPLSDVLDTERVGVVGHSYGGYTALAVAGGQFDLTALGQRCKTVTDPFVASFFCDPFLAGGAELADLLGLREVPVGLWPSFVDDRVDVIVPIAGDAYLFGDTGLARIEVPALMVGGTADTGTPWDWGADQAFDAVSSPWRGLVGLAGGEHMLPATSCDNMPWTVKLPEDFAALLCSDPVWSKEDAHAIINHVTTAFLLDQLSGDERAAAALDPDLFDDPTVQVVVARANLPR